MSITLYPSDFSSSNYLGVEATTFSELVDEVNSKCNGLTPSWEALGTFAIADNGMFCITLRRTTFVS